MIDSGTLDRAAVVIATFLWCFIHYTFTPWRTLVSNQEANWLEIICGNSCCDRWLIECFQLAPVRCIGIRLFAANVLLSRLIPHFLAWYQSVLILWTDRNLVAFDQALSTCTCYTILEKNKNAVLRGDYGHSFITRTKCLMGVWKLHLKEWREPYSLPTHLFNIYSRYNGCQDLPQMSRFTETVADVSVMCGRCESSPISISESMLK